MSDFSSWNLGAGIDAYLRWDAENGRWLRNGTPVDWSRGKMDLAGLQTGKGIVLRAQAPEYQWDTLPGTPDPAPDHRRWRRALKVKMQLLDADDDNHAWAKLETCQQVTCKVIERLFREFAKNTNSRQGLMPLIHNDAPQQQQLGSYQVWVPVLRIVDWTQEADARDHAQGELVPGSDDDTFSHF